jgi:hypothetical protein
MHHYNPTVSPQLTPQSSLRRRASNRHLTKGARDSTAMGEHTMPVLNFPNHRSTLSRNHSIIASVLLVLCIPIFIYHLVPTFTHATDDFVTVITTKLRGQSSQCTSEVGSAYCCTLFLDATPCIDACRKQHVNRVTWVLTKEYDECADTCLAKYDASCKVAEG